MKLHSIGALGRPQAAVKRSLGASGRCIGRATEHRCPDAASQKRHTTEKSTLTAFCPCNPPIGETEVVQISGIFIRPGIATHLIVGSYTPPVGGSLVRRVDDIQRVACSI